MTKLTLRTIQIISISLVIAGSIAASTFATTYPVRCKNGNSVVCQELAAKEYLFKHSPNNGGGMPQLVPWRTQAEKRKYEHEMVSAAIKQTPEIAQWFLSKKYVGSRFQDATLYPIVFKLQTISLIKNKNGFDYAFKSGFGCHEYRYSGSITMDGQRVTTDTAEMKEFTVPC